VTSDRTLVCEENVAGASLRMEGKDSVPIEASSIRRGRGGDVQTFGGSIKQESGERNAPMQLFILLLSFFAFLRITRGAHGAPPSKIYGVNLGSW
jgi:hypothetical protein